MLKKNQFACLLIVFSFLTMTSCHNQRSAKPRILFFSKTAGYHHSSIDAGLKAIATLGATNSFDVDTTTDAAMFEEDTLKRYAALVFLNSTGDLLSGNQEIALERYIQAGGGFVGIHAAADAEYDWGWYGRMIGAYFLSHPHIQQAKLMVTDKSHPSTQGLPDSWTRTDEWYNFKKISKDIHVLMTIDEKSYQGGVNGESHPMAWYHDFDGGRVFYTELGHTEESYTDSLYLKHILGGIQYAIGTNAKPDYARAHSEFAPSEDRFVKNQLVEGTFFEPTELTILPNLDILISQRRGEIMLYKSSTGQVKQVGFLNVFFKSDKPGVNPEEGLLGIKADPDFDKNHWVYVFYSPYDTSVNRLSRFTFEKDTLDPKSEKVVLQFYSQRNICCHTGGSIAFGPDKSLFVSTGDNTNPFNEPKQPFQTNSYAPLDDRPGHEQYDDRRGAGNSNDLRGKILRIRMKEDGSYDIPQGNLFPKGMEKTRPEIYVMGDRNPYRISVDQKNGFLYWGEVGPDANEDSLDTRGPRGYDEINQARKAGFFGWPFFVGNNYPYRSFNYETGQHGDAFDPAKPINDSRNNTGLRELPPAQPAFIWYPYAKSPDFPSVGTGGRAAMAGPVYYSDLFPKETRYPSYYDGKFFFYEWIRGFIKPVTMLPNGDYDRMEPFMEHTKFNSPIDMELGPDGRIYILEYGNGWFMKNPDAGLVRIDYIAGNRPPKILKAEIDRETGGLPMVVHAKVQAKDPENETLHYTWNFGNGVTLESADPEASYTYQKPGDYMITVDVRDPEGATSKSEALHVYAGNEMPSVSINIMGNKSFYFPDQDVKYAVSVTDKDDTAAARKMAGLYVSSEYVEGLDKAGTTLGHQQATAVISGKNLMMTYDCKSCHKVDEPSIGPSFTSVASKYAKTPDITQTLVSKIRKGGGGVWGETVMAAHPGIPTADLNTIVRWVLSLGQKTVLKPSLPAAGSIRAAAGVTNKNKSVLVISASYTDKGGEGIKPLTASATASLRSSLLPFSDLSNTQGYESADYNDASCMVTPKGFGWFSLDHIDLTGLKAADLMIYAPKGTDFGYAFELRLDDPGGKILAKGTWKAPAVKASGGKSVLPPAVLSFGKLEPVNDGRLHNLYLVTTPLDDKESKQLFLAGLKVKNK